MTDKRLSKTFTLEGDMLYIDMWGKIHLQLTKKSMELMRAYHSMYKELKKLNDVDFQHPIQDDNRVRVSMNKKDKAEHNKYKEYILSRVVVEVKATPYHFGNARGYFLALLARPTVVELPEEPLSKDPIIDLLCQY